MLPADNTIPWEVLGRILVIVGKPKCYQQTTRPHERS